MAIAICAKCGKEKELCDSVRIDGIKQPRLCKDCVIAYLKTGDDTINETFWGRQIVQLNDTESINAINGLKGQQLPLN